MKAIKSLLLSTIFSRPSKNLFNGEFPDPDGSIKPIFIEVGDGNFTLSNDGDPPSPGTANIFFASGKKSSGFSSGTNGVWKNNSKTFASQDGFVTIAYRMVNGQPPSPADSNTMLEKGNVATEYEPYGTIYRDVLETLLLMKGVKA